jgi:hypothetical protein
LSTFGGRCSRRLGFIFLAQHSYFQLNVIDYNLITIPVFPRSGSFPKALERLILQLQESRCAGIPDFGLAIVANSRLLACLSAAP